MRTFFICSCTRGKLAFRGLYGRKGQADHFKDGRALVIDEDNEVIMTAYREGRLYQLAEEMQYAKITRVRNESTCYTED